MPSQEPRRLSRASRAAPAPSMLVAAAQRALGAKKKRGLAPSVCLHLAAELLSVSVNLKPAVLYDLNAAGATQIQNYVRSLQGLGFLPPGLHILQVAGSILVVSLEGARRHLERVLGGCSPTAFVDVSASQACPDLCPQDRLREIQRLVTELLSHLKGQERVPPMPVFHSEFPPADWNLCTMFGVLLGYPIPYVFSAEEGYDRCLSLTPLRVFTAQASCCRIGDFPRVKLYSFSVPESLYPILKERLDAWEQNLKAQAQDQTDFANLSISTEVVTLAAVAL
ncbi:UPF0739 protein C1orf74 homolog [Tachyglossus aculeatus]|uniref:UPF0739 protein C1orf74 homolog n=1 Tax=Tachyglossus aculeatus TaxID=9261 RepID=UPI0018F68E31|nr:UPF0739 protein C1orf74 homolog [Tachyglossus aculeatus]XP_038605273.1 UPF0739 protein C1orf74 homolog [Tachyglossus aculeatus]